MMKRWYKVAKIAAPAIPERIKESIRSFVPLKDYDIARQMEVNPYLNQTAAEYPGSTYRLGILEDIYQDHQYYIAACRDMGISYQVIDLLAEDWIDRLRQSRCDAIVVWPSCGTTTVKQAFDNRLRFVENDLGLLLYPSWKECWLTEHKPRIRDWLEAHQLPHPRTWVFYKRDDAVRFAEVASLPVVCKTATGAGGAGVKVLRSRAALRRTIRKAFGRGLRPARYDAYDRQRGFIYLQEYLSDVEEWRMVRIADSYFGYRKEKGEGGLHSGSHRWSWLDPGSELLNLLKDVTDVGGFSSMDVDIFRRRDGRLLINELQTVFGCNTPAIQMKVDGVEGRYVRVGQNWHFEPGDYWANQMCNLRVEHVLSKLNRRKRGNVKSSSHRSVR